ncbi:hypothetical protein [Paenibacillus sp. Marseille-Q9583]
MPSIVIVLATLPWTNILYTDEVFTVAINPNLDKDSRVMVRETSDGRVMAVLMHAMADKVGLYQRQDLSEKIIRRKLNEAGVTLHGGDYLFYFSEADKNVLLIRIPGRRLAQVNRAR